MLLPKLQLMATGEKYQIDILERGAKANDIKEAVDILQCAFECIYLKIVSNPGFTELGRFILM